MELNTIFTHVIDYIKQLPYPFHGQEIFVPHNQISIVLPLSSPSSGLMGGGIRLPNFVFKNGTDIGVTSISFYYLNCSLSSPSLSPFQMCLALQCNEWLQGSTYCVLKYGWTVQASPSCLSSLTHVLINWCCCWNFQYAMVSTSVTFLMMARKKKTTKIFTLKCQLFINHNYQH